MSENEEHEPYGSDWRKEMMKRKKHNIVHKLQNSLEWNEFYKRKIEELKCKKTK